jgi:nitrate/nitrite transport system substrate-binding protein
MASTPKPTTGPLTSGTALPRRDFLRQAGTLAGGAALYTRLGHHGAWAAGSDAPEKKEVRIGFIPLTDCASVVMASVLAVHQEGPVRYGALVAPAQSHMAAQLVWMQGPAQAGQILR